MKSLLLFIGLTICQFAYAQPDMDNTEIFEDEIHMVYSVKVEVIDSVEAMSSYNDEEFVPEPIYIPKDHSPVKLPAAPAAKVKKYDKIYTSNKNYNIIYLEADPKQMVKQIHVVNTTGFEVKCFPKVEEVSGLIKCDITGLPAGRFQFILDGAYTVTREINVIAGCEVAQIK